MLKSFNILLFGIIIFSLLVIAGCGDDSTTSSGSPTTSQLQIADIEALIERVAPPEYTAPSGMPAVIDSIWFYGTTPLLGNVFGSEQPEALYSNIREFKQSLEIITNTMRVDGDGNIITGIYVDSHLVDRDEGPSMLHFTATVTALSEPTAIPVEAQALFGTEVDIDYLINVASEEMPNALINIGMTLNDSEQTLFQFDTATGDPTDRESRLIYARLNPADSSFVFKGLIYCLHQDNDLFSCAFDVRSQATSDFSDRVSWYSNSSPENDLLNCIVGGGNKDVEFALKYRVFIPADTNVVDSICMYDQVFGPNYSEGTGLVSSYSEYLDDGLILTYDIVPQAMLTNPWANQ